MKYVLCYGDSNTWGCIPETFGRYDFDVRWTGVAQKELGSEYHLYENALNGRTTVFEDPIEEGRNGRDGFEATLMENAPLDAIVLFLGINDVKIRFHQEPWDIAWGMELLISLIEKQKVGRDGKTPAILVVSPVYAGTTYGKSLHGTVFDAESTRKTHELPETYEFIAKMHNCRFLNAGEVAKAGPDGVHLFPEDHKKLGLAIAKELKSMIG